MSPLPPPHPSEPAVPSVDLAVMVEPITAVDAGLEEAGALVDPDRAEACWSACVSRWLAALQGELPPPWRSPAYSLSLSLVEDASIARLNQDWRQVSGATDVLAFAALEQAPPGLALDTVPLVAGEALELGDIVISLDTASRQAQDAGHGLRRELLFLASHGLLHLLGWDHPDDDSLAAMLERQEQLIQLVHPST
ncbi:MAG: rRNA maturation RNase YbeY [Cyanobium sp.]|jgi:probable rRNA maturation factor